MPVRHVSASVIPFSDLRRATQAIRDRAYKDMFRPLTGDEVPQQLRGSFPAGTYSIGKVGNEDALLFLSGNGVYAITLLTQDKASRGRIEQVPILQSRVAFGKAPEDFGGGSSLPQFSDIVSLLAQLSYVGGNLS